MDGEYHFVTLPWEGALKMKKYLISTFWSIPILLMFFGVFLVAAQEGLSIMQVKDGFDYKQPLSAWEKKINLCDDCHLEEGVSLRYYACYDSKFLYFGFYVTDPFLSFNDDYSLDFQGSDHLRIYFLPSEKKPSLKPLILYLLPSSKIKEPLFNISGGSWRRQSIKINSILGEKDYFVTMAIPLAELNISAYSGQEIRIQIMINDITSKGKTRKLWVNGNKLEDYSTLVFSR